MFPAPVQAFVTDLQAVLTQGADQVAQIKMLAHYTSMQALASILASQELWLSCARDMNDIEEVSGATAILAEALKAYGPTSFKSVNFAATGAVEQFNRLRQSLDHDTFIWSLSDHREEQDRVAMWGNYGHDGNGLCVVFRKAALLDQNANGKFPAKWCPIFYGNRDSLMCMRKTNNKCAEPFAERIVRWTYQSRRAR